MTYTFSSKYTGKNSYRLGNCQVCGILAPKVFVVTQYRNEERNGKSVSFAVDNVLCCEGCSNEIIKKQSR